MAQQDRAVRTRRAVLRAAAAVFAERGYAAATISEILKRAGVTKGALYFHFDSKAALAQGVLQEQLTPQYHLPRELKLQEWVDAGMTLARRLPRSPSCSPVSASPPTGPAVTCSAAPGLPGRG
ncbi:TetR family transcriptional regulator [Streptomyces nogalater]